MGACIPRVSVGHLVIRMIILTPLRDEGGKRWPHGGVMLAQDSVDRSFGNPGGRLESL